MRLSTERAERASSFPGALVNHIWVCRSRRIDLPFTPLSALLISITVEESEEESEALAMPSDFIERPVSLHAEGGYNQEQFDIVLM